MLEFLFSSISPEKSNVNSFGILFFLTLKFCWVKENLSYASLLRSLRCFLRSYAICESNWITDRKVFAVLCWDRLTIYITLFSLSWLRSRLILSLSSFLSEVEAYLEKNFLLLSIEEAVLSYSYDLACQLTFPVNLAS